MRKNLKLGLFGFGVVGQGLYHVLHETKGLKAEIKKICVKTKNKSPTRSPLRVGLLIGRFGKTADDQSFTIFK